MKPIAYVYPNGAQRALTFSYDDGRTHDRRLVEILNKYGLKGTFHLNSGKLDQPDYITSAELPALFAEHEVASHTVNHPYPSHQPTEVLVEQIVEDRKALEGIMGRVIKGFSYPFGDICEQVVTAAKAAGIDYARTVNSHSQFFWPSDFMLWHPTCHHNADLQERFMALLTPRPWAQLGLMYVWGHSYEFANDNGWDRFEEFCATAAQSADEVWFATNIQIMDYIQAVRGLKWSADGSYVKNTSVYSVYVKTASGFGEIPPGTTKVV